MKNMYLWHVLFGHGYILWITILFMHHRAATHTSQLLQPIWGKNTRKISNPALTAQDQIS